MLGKRKRETRVVSRREKPTKEPRSIPDLNSIFRKHFEESFAPLPETSSNLDDYIDEHDDSSEDSIEDSEVSDWSGLSDSDNDQVVVEVIDHTLPQNDHEIDRAQKKAFMSSKPPRNPVPIANDPTKEDDPAEKMNMKHDIDLQRLLKESHLLEQARKTDGAKQRQMALDMRLQELGARDSLFKQEKMPASHRRGINLKATQKESQRRKDAKENGIILEKQSLKKNSSRRVRGVDVPGVGKFSGGTLKLSKRDVASIQGPSRGKPRRR